jgi:hypothetical protein
MKNLMLTILLFLILTKCFSQNRNFIRFDQEGISPPRVSSTIIMEKNILNYNKKIADTFIVDTTTFDSIKILVEKSNLIDKPAGPLFGTMEITIAVETDSAIVVKEKFYTRSREQTISFLANLSKWLSTNNLNPAIVHWIDGNLLRQLN